MLDRPRRNRRLTLGPLAALMGLVLLVTACSGATAGGGSTRRSMDSVTGDELRLESGAANVYDALQDVRPAWLRPRGRSSIAVADSNEPVVYVQGVQYGPLSALRSMDVQDVRSISYISPVDATTRFGTGHGGGVIDVDLARF